MLGRRGEGEVSVGFQGDSPIGSTEESSHSHLGEREDRQTRKTVVVLVDSLRDTLAYMFLIASNGDHREGSRVHEGSKNGRLRLQSLINHRAGYATGESAIRFDVRPSQNCRPISVARSDDPVIYTR